jgi:hypothetical protein
MALRLSHQHGMPCPGLRHAINKNRNDHTTLAQWFNRRSRLTLELFAKSAAQGAPPGLRFAYPPFLTPK